jgi:penicillin amidase/acyl-homoserine-lactone acylase
MPARTETRWLTRIVAFTATLLALRVVLAPRPPARPSPRLAAVARRHDVRILRDSWGVPHVFGRTDADAAYGLAWAHAEDDFPTIQGALLAARGRLASAFGPSGAPNDYMVALLRVWDVVEGRYERDVSPEARAVCEGYADGINHYAALHPGGAIPGLYPVRGQDVVAGFVHKLPLFFGLDRVLSELFGPTRPEPPSHRAQARHPGESDATRGSNAIAVAPRRSADGYTRLAVNSHQPWTGPVAWYEVHLRSEQGWDMVGGVFPGAPVVLHGHNRDLGWAHTVNRPRLIDVYVLETNPANPNQYRFDGAWRDLEVRTVPIEVKLFGPLHWTFSRETLWSVHGPVVRRPHGTYAIRFAGMGEVRQVEQWYRMNRARSLEEWHAAMRMGALPMFNCGYADRNGNIEYLYNARLPRRTGSDEGYLAGDTSPALWTEYLSFDELPRVTNPPSGFVINSNSSPFQATLGPGNPDPARYPPSLGIETHLTNRAQRALELFGGDASLTREAFDRYKFDTAYSPRSTTARRFHEIVDGPLPDDPLIREAADVLRRWNLDTDIANPATALALLTLRPGDGDQPPPLERFALLARLEDAARTLKQRHARLDVPWGEVHRLRRGRLDLPVGGGPDTLHAVYARPAADGRLVGWAGDSYVLQVEWDPEGRVRSRSIHQYGSATLDERSPHYADQAPLFARRELKPVWLDEAEIRQHLEREYRPGQETLPGSRPHAAP